MDYTCRTKTLQALAKAMDKNTISLTHKLQREEGQWNRKKKTDLIDMAGVTSNIIAKMGKGELVSMDSLKKICSALNCDIGDIVTVNNPKTLLNDIRIKDGRDPEYLFVNGLSTNWEGDSILTTDLELKLAPVSP